MMMFYLVRSDRKLSLEVFLENKLKSRLRNFVDTNLSQFVVYIAHKYLLRFFYEYGTF